MKNTFFKKYDFVIIPLGIVLFSIVCGLTLTFFGDSPKTSISTQSPAQGCIDVQGKLISYLTTKWECKSLVELCTRGKITGSLAGETFFLGDATYPAVGFPLSEEDTTLAYTGDMSIQTDKGTIHLLDTGIFDTKNGVFVSRELIRSGTEKYKNSKGYLLFSGTAKDGQLTSTYTGRICW